MSQFVPGQKSTLNKFTSNLQLTVGVSVCPPTPSSVDICCFGIDENGQLSDDRYMVFFNQKRSPCGSVLIIDKESNDSETFSVDLSSLPNKIKKLVFTASIDGSETMGDMISGYIRIAELGNNIIDFQLSGKQFDNQKAVMLGELYMKDVWRFGAIGQGFNGGLSALLKYFGGEEIKEEDYKSEAIPQSEPEKKINLAKGKVNLKKGDKPVIIEKTPHLTATVTWKSGTDYDIYALVMLKSGQEISIAMFGADGVPPLQNYGNGKVAHRGDVVGDRSSNRSFFGRFSSKSQKGINTEIVDIRLSDDIIAVVPVAYSAQSNGTGSFYRYKVSLEINNGAGASVDISADTANNNDHIYTCVPGIIYNKKEGVEIERLESYSAPNSENRPMLQLTKNNTINVLMDKGPRNYYK